MNLTEVPEIVYINLKSGKLSFKKSSKNYVEYVLIKRKDYSKIEKDIKNEKDPIRKGFLIMILTICRYFNITIESFFSHSKVFARSLPRQFSYQILYELKRDGYEQLASNKFAEMLSFNHATLVTMARRLRKEICVSQETKQMFNELYDIVLKNIKKQGLVFEEIIRKKEERMKRIYKKCPHCWEWKLKDNRCLCCGYDTIKKFQIM